MKYIVTILKSRSGMSYPATVAIVLSLLLIFCAVAEYSRTVIIAQGVRDAVQVAVTEAVNDNYRNVYPAVREGYAGGYKFSDESGIWNEKLNYGSLYTKIGSILGLRPLGSKYVKYNTDGIEFQISNLKIDIKNVGFAPNVNNHKFVITSNIDLEIPMRFGGKVRPSIKINLNVKGGYIQKF